MLLLQRPATQVVSCNQLLLFLCNIDARWHVYWLNLWKKNCLWRMRSKVRYPGSACQSVGIDREGRASYSCELFFRRLVSVHSGTLSLSFFVSVSVSVSVSLSLSVSPSVTACLCLSVCLSLSLSLCLSVSLSLCLCLSLVCARALDRAREQLIVPDMSALLLLCNQYQRLTDSVLLRQSSRRYCVLHCPGLWHWQTCILMALRRL